jgi:hypothetical protein
MERGTLGPTKQKYWAMGTHNLNHGDSTIIEEIFYQTTYSASCNRKQQNYAVTH